MSIKGASLQGGPGPCSPGKLLRYVPLKHHVLDFEITVNRNTAPKIIAGSWLDAKRVKVAEKQHKIGKGACLRADVCKYRPEVGKING